MKNKYIYYITVFVILVILFEIIIKIDSPKFFKDKVEILKHNKEVLRNIGVFKDFEYSFNERYLNTDTLNFRIIIYGEKGKLINEGKVVKGESNDWNLYNESFCYKFN